MNPPTKLNTAAKVYWRRFDKVLTITDRTCEPVAVLCDSLARYWRHSATVEEQGDVVPTITGIGHKAHPLLSRVDKEREAILRYCKLLGIDSDVMLTAPEPQQDELEKMFDEE